MDETDEIPTGCKRIYHARVSGYILRKNNTGGGFHRQPFSYEMVYKEGSEKDKDSHFIYILEKSLDIKHKKKEFYKITDIDKFKYISFSVPPNEGISTVQSDKETKTQWYE